MWIAQRALLAIAKTFKPKQQVESNYDIEREYLKLKVSIEVFFYYRVHGDPRAQQRCMR